MPPCSAKLPPPRNAAGTAVDVARLASTMDKLSTAAVRF
jgi:hypothetical protein